MPKLEYLDNLYKDYKSPFIDLLNKYHKEGDININILIVIKIKRVLSIKFITGKLI
tara:strand:+ start:118 stop:285 length:168 start_codon:yes stop_codon:yes gene_type:complete